MLREIKRTHQDSPNLLKRWFTSQDYDLFVWSEIDEASPNNGDSASINRFHLSIKKLNDEYAIYWDIEEGFDTFRIDEGSQPGKHPQSPLMLRSEVSKIHLDLAQLKIEFSGMDYHTASFILNTLESSQN